MEPSTLIHGDCLDAMRGLAPDSVDAVVSDPPYGLSFMGRAWDHGVPGVPFWDAALRAAKPGAYLLAFGGTRTYHRLTCAIEDAGWEVHDCLSWLYGSGFPKHKSKLKPAWEPIVLARKPAPRATLLNVDACRIGTGGQLKWETRPGMGYGGAERADALVASEATAGRWPANVLLDEGAAAALDAQTGESTSPSKPVRQGGNHRHDVGLPNTGTREGFGVGYGDTGGASRFFYCAKASRSEREAGLGDLPERLTRRYGEQGQGPLPQQTPRMERAARNHHPTVKPISLMRWLVRLVTPEGGLVLDPFMGSGTTGCAAALEGRRFVGMDLSAEYVEIARARIAHWARVAADTAPELPLGMPERDAA